MAQIKKKSKTRAARKQQTYYANKKPIQKTRYDAAAITQYYIEKKKKGQLTGYAKQYSNSYIKVLIQKTYESDVDWQGARGTKARYKEIIEELNKSEFARSAAMRGKDNVWRNLLAWGQSQLFEQLGGKMYDSNHLFSVDSHTWVYNTTDGHIIMSVSYNGSTSIPQFDMAFVSESEIQQYGPEENTDTAYYKIWEANYAR